MFCEGPSTSERAYVERTSSLRWSNLVPGIWIWLGEENAFGWGDGPWATEGIPGGLMTMALWFLLGQLEHSTFSFRRTCTRRGWEYLEKQVTFKKTELYYSWVFEILRIYPAIHADSIYTDAIYTGGSGSKDWNGAKMSRFVAWIWAYVLVWQHNSGSVKFLQLAS